ncbi:LacI family DNA-binding transcriptional regulator [Acidisoma cellulosilytica]|uniref:LacI family DNA-binding transcriptional regulator n=1 Tax=Acidisoma cellulosilyticum TaxID=2802395 RepID=A0A963Z3J4_9PROT|nr:LacI family DNA-binding transcriptional regulator [Acidisoma cellulosilyticum]MCB8882094.1 LacI family DNA-binding transcriptional regulator [Acidisoma cellulosilyticum]
MKETRKSDGQARITDVAQAAGVSVSTVDRVINGRNPVRRPTAEKVLQAAEALGFRGAPVIGRRWSVERPALRFGFLLLQKHRSFYQALALDILKAAEGSTGARISAHILHAENLAPTAVAAQIKALGAEVDAIAVVAANHPLIAAALEGLAAQGVAVFALISDISASVRVGYIGLDNHAVGRTAGWFIAQMAQQPGKVAVLVGTHRFRCQDLNESGFRSYFREHAPQFEVIEPGATLEDANVAAELVRHLLQREPDLRGLYIAGGGIGGVLTALRESPSAKAIVTIGNDRTSAAHQGLLDGHIRLLLSHPLPALCSTLIDRMTAAARGHADAMAPCFLDLHIETAESSR